MRLPVTLCASLMLIACGDDDKSTPDATQSTAADATNADVSQDVVEEIGPTEGCPMGGTWRMQNVLCNEDEDITAEWSSIVTRTIFAITPSANGCTMRITLETENTCKEEETATLTSKAGDVWLVVSAGIQSCTPDACTFGGQDAACANGDRAATYDGTFTLDSNKLYFTSEEGPCGQTSAGATTTFVLQPQ